MGVEARHRQRCGKMIEHVGAHHVAADAGRPPVRKIERHRFAIDAPRREIIAEARRIGDRRLVVRHQLEPQRRPAGKGRRRQIVDRHLPHHRRQAEADETHVVIERQPREGAVIAA